MYSSYQNNYSVQQPTMSSSSTASSESMYSYSGNSYVMYNDQHQTAPSYYNSYYSNGYQSQYANSYPITNSDSSDQSAVNTNFTSYQPAHSPVNFGTNELNQAVYTSTPIQNQYNYCNYYNYNYANNSSNGIQSNDSPPSSSSSAPSATMSQSSDDRSNENAILNEITNMLTQQVKRRASNIEKIELPKNPSKTCSACKIPFKTLAELLIHKSVYHDNNDSKTCPICDKRFANSNNVVIHTMHHTDERQFKCNTCEASFYDASSLHKHELTHFAKKPFICSFCGKDFAQKGNLKKHQFNRHKTPSSK